MENITSKQICVSFVTTILLSTVTNPNTISLDTIMSGKHIQLQDRSFFVNIRVNIICM